MWQRAFSFVLFAIGLAAPLWAADDVLFGPVPDWVTERAVTQVEASSSETPVRILLLDFQVRLNPDSQTYFTAMRLKFLSPPGLSAGNIALPWRSETDELTVHRLQILRGDKAIDVLAEGQTFTVLRREQIFEQAMLTGVLTANMFPEGLEVGDILDLAYSVEIRHPVLNGHIEAAFGPFNSPADQVSVKVLWPSRSEINLSESKGLPEWSRRREGSYRTAEFDLRQIVPVVPPPGAPPRYSMIRFAEASDYSGWGEVAKLFVPLYREASQIPSDGPLRAEVEKIRAATEDPGERAERALTLVQDRIRYVALAMGAAGYVPADAATTWSRRFGDCKAKTALLIGILAELGIEAEPVAVSSVLGDTLPDRLPTVGAFDHVIVRARIADKTYFMDGTRTGDASLALLRVPYYKWGLPIDDDENGLIPMVPAPLTLPENETTIRMDASAGLYAPVPSQMERVLRGDLAQMVLAGLNQLVGNSQRQALEQYWTEDYDFVTPDDVSFTYDRDKGELRLVLRGTSELDWDGVWLETSDMRVGFNADFAREPGPNSDTPFTVTHPFSTSVTQVITLPPGFDTSSIRGEAIDETIAGREYRRSFGITENVFTAKRSTRSLVGEISAAEAANAEQRLNDLGQKRLHLRKPENYRLSQADIAALGDTKSDDAGALIEMGVGLLDANELDKALKVLDRAAELEPQNAWAWGNRAVVLARKLDFDGAEASAARAERLAPNNYLVWHAKAIAAEQQGKTDEAIAAYSKAIELYEEDTFALSQRMRLNFDAGRFEDGNADSHRLLELDPDNLLALISEANALQLMGRNEESEALANSLVQRFGDNGFVLNSVSHIYRALRLEDKARTMLEEAIANGPNAAALTEQARILGKDDKKQAIAQLTQALKLDPKYIPALIARADLYWLDYQNELAIADADAAIALLPTALPAYNTKAEALMDLNRAAEADEVADQLVEALPYNANALGTAAHIYARLEENKKAIGIADQLVAIFPSDALALVMAAQTYNQSGDRKEGTRNRSSERTTSHPTIRW